MDHTALKIFELIGLVELTDQIEKGQSLILVSEFGFDGCTSQSVYNYIQGVTEDGERLEEAVEQSLFLTCTVPLRLYITETGRVLWEITKPSSTLLCTLQSREV